MLDCQGDDKNAAIKALLNLMVSRQRDACEKDYLEWQQHDLTSGDLAKIKSTETTYTHRQKAAINLS